MIQHFATNVKMILTFVHIYVMINQKRKNMTKELRIVDHGKDYGFGRWVVTAPELLEKPFGTNTFEDVMVLVDEFGYCNENEKGE
jgi:hypothetical protein